MYHITDTPIEVDYFKVQNNRKRKYKQQTAFAWPPSLSPSQNLKKTNGKTLIGLQK